MLLWLLVSLCCNGQGYLTSPALTGTPSERGKGVRQAIIDTALSQVGLREATGKNDGHAVEKYLKACGLGKGYAWCAAFLTWNFKVNHVKTVVTAWAPNWFPASKTLFKGRVRDAALNRVPEPCDVFGLWINNRIGHVGFIYRWPQNSKVVQTIEGNTNEAGSREGDGVYIKRRLKGQIYCVSRWVE